MRERVAHINWKEEGRKKICRGSMVCIVVNWNREPREEHHTCVCHLNIAANAALRRE